jgi:threonylcarbamoyladenosine tRNA methylthiotransferase MtaB
MPHLHLSLQHGATDPEAHEAPPPACDAVELVADLKARRPDIAVGADLIAGFHRG